MCIRDSFCRGGRAPDGSRPCACGVRGGAVRNLYQDIILDHAKRPHHAGLREPFDAQVHHINPTCGDDITLRVHLVGEGPAAVIADVSYDALGCSISTASTSVLADEVIGHTAVSYTHL